MRKLVTMPRADWAIVEDARQIAEAEINGDGPKLRLSMNAYCAHCLVSASKDRLKQAQAD